MKISKKVNDINIKSRTYYFFNDIINIDNFDPNNIKVDDKSHKNILIYYVGYVMIKEYVNISGVNPLYLISRYVNVCFEDAINHSDFVILNINLSENEAIYLLQSADLIEENGTL